jgi:hypothetical protein
MRIAFPSAEFDDSVAAVCHYSASDEQLRGLNELLRTNSAARDEYILRLELHSRLASDPDLFALGEPDLSTAPKPLRTMLRKNVPPSVIQRQILKTPITWAVALAACVALIGTGLWSRRPAPPLDQGEPTSKAVAMLNRTADAQWNQAHAGPRLNAPLEPGLLRLEAGLAQVVFYSGARVVIEGPAELDLISQNEAFCRRGRIFVDVPAQARGFRVNTPHVTTVDMGTSFGLNVNDGESAVHVFKGKVSISSNTHDFKQSLEAGSGALIQANSKPSTLAADTAAFASLFDLQSKSEAAEARRYDQWRTACKRLEADSSLILHFDFENVPPSSWQIRNHGKLGVDVWDATVVGCQWTEGRWPGKRAVEFQSVNDRMRLVVPGEFHSLTLSAWVCVKGLDRKINSLFMSDGFDSGTIHWLIRRDGVLGLTVIGAEPRNHQIVTSPPVLTLENLGMWLHLAVVLDASAQRVIHYFNGVAISETDLRIAPPFRIGAAELGNWNAKGFPKDDPFMIRNFSGAMDEFLMFNRALDTEGIRTLYAQGKPQGDTTVR